MKARIEIEIEVGHMPTDGEYELMTYIEATPNVTTYMAISACFSDLGEVNSLKGNGWIVSDGPDARLNLTYEGIQELIEYRVRRGDYYDDEAKENKMIYIMGMATPVNPMALWGGIMLGCWVRTKG